MMNFIKNRKDQTASGVKSVDNTQKKRRAAPVKFVLLCVAVALIAVLGPPAVVMADRQRRATAVSLAEKAARLESEKLYRESAECYLSAYEAGGSTDPELLMRAAACHRALADRSAFLSDCRKAVSGHPCFTPGYEELADYFARSGEYAEAAEILEQAAARGVESDRIESIRDEVDHTLIRKYIAADSVGDWRRYGARQASAVYRKGDLYGVMTADGSHPLTAAYDGAGVYDAATGTCPVEAGGEFFYVNEKGERVISLPGIERAGPFGCGLAPVSDGSGEFYVDAKGRRVSEAVYEFAGSFSRGAAAVCSGGSWGLIDTSGCSLSPLSYDYILTDGNGFCSEYGLIIAVRDGSYCFLDVSGNRLADGFEEAARAASDDGWIAVKRDGLWGFADRAGKTRIEPAYEDARSFSYGLAPVKTADGWGYIDCEGRARTAFEYDEAGPLSAGGSCVVNKNGQLFLLVLAKFD